MYHGSPPARRETILAEGLRATARDDRHLGYECPRGVFLATTSREASYFGSDVWEVDTRGLTLRVDPDSYNENGHDDNYYVETDVTADRLRLARAG
jgi:hypothetical protein